MNATAMFYENSVQEVNETIIFPQASKPCENFEDFSYENFKWYTNIFCHTCFRVTYVCCGVLQFFAIWENLIKIFHDDNIIIMLISLISGLLPIIGTVCGIHAAHMHWNWSLSYCIFVFIIPYFVANSPLFMITVIDTHKDRQRWKAMKKKLQL